MKLKLHQFLARAGAAKNNFQISHMIKKGRVTVDGEVVTAESFIFDAKKRRVFVDGKPIKLQPTRYFLVNKPKGHSCQRGEYPNITDLFNTIMKDQPAMLRSLFVVGRLDRDTEGLLIVTNDGQVASKILQPVEKIEKEYEAIVEGNVKDKVISQLESGVIIKVEDENYTTKPAKVEVVKRKKMPTARMNTTVVRIVITEGKKRQVRQMFEVVGHPVVSLKRLRIGSLKLEGLGNRWVVELPRTEILKSIGM